MENLNLFPQSAFRIGPIVVMDTVVTTWGVMFLLVALSWVLGRRVRLLPEPVQVVAEGIVTAIEKTVRDMVPEQAQRVLPFIATLWIYIVVANLSGIIPGVYAPTRDLSATAALAVLVFLSVHWFGVSSVGLKKYLRHYLIPNPILLPFHLIGELTRTMTLAIRLFGNMMSLEVAALLVLMVAGFLAPVPLLMLHIVEALVQAYIFGMLALVYIAGGIQSQQLTRSQGKE